jgi:outer membrane autotransporter protein
MSWFKTDYTEANGSSADNARATMFSLGGRAYYKWINNPQPGQMSVSPFIGLRWNRYRQSAYGYDTGMYSKAWSANQVHMPLGMKFQWGEMKSKNGWSVIPSLEFSYIRTFGNRRAATGIWAKGDVASVVNTPLSDRDTFAAQFRYTAKRKNFQWDLNAGLRRSTSQKDYSVGTTLKWDL